MTPKLSRSFIPILLLGATLIVSLNAWIAFRAVQSLNDSQHWVEHTWQVINQVEQIMSSAKDAETGNRGFLLTGDESTWSLTRARLRSYPARWIGISR